MYDKAIHPKLAYNNIFLTRPFKNKLIDLKTLPKNKPVFLKKDYKLI